VSTLYRPKVVSYRLPGGAYRTPDGQRVTSKTPGAERVESRSPTWWGRYTDRAGREHQVRLDRSKDRSRRMLAKLAGDAQLAGVGLADPYEKHREQPLAAHLEDFAAALAAKGTSAKQVGQVTSRVRRVLDGCGFNHLADLSASAVAEFLAGLRQTGRVLPELPRDVEEFTKAELSALLGVTLAGVNALVRRHRLPATGNGKARRFPRDTAETLRQRHTRGRSVQTSNFYLQAVKQFCRWLVRDRRMPDNSLAHLEGGNPRLDRRHDRRPLSAQELARLLGAAEASTRTFRGLSGADRRMVYALSCVTGLRADELAALTPHSFDLDATPPTATVPSGYTKNHALAVQPLPADIAAALRGYLDGRPAKRPLWPGTWHEKAADMLRIDLDAAGIPYAVEGPDGPLYADFHALRHSYVALLDKAGVTLKEAMQLARHSDPKLTMARYGRAQLNDLGAAVDKLPAILAAPAGVPQAAAAGSA
jgi:integrase